MENKRVQKEAANQELINILMQNNRSNKEYQNKNEWKIGLIINTPSYKTVSYPKLLMQMVKTQRESKISKDQ